MRLKVAKVVAIKRLTSETGADCLASSGSEDQLK